VFLIPDFMQKRDLLMLMKRNDIDLADVDSVQNMSPDLEFFNHLHRSPVYTLQYFITGKVQVRTFAAVIVERLIDQVIVHHHNAPLIQEPGSNISLYLAPFRFRSNTARRTLAICSSDLPIFYRAEQDGVHKKLRVVREDVSLSQSRLFEFTFDGDIYRIVPRPVHRSPKSTREEIKRIEYVRG
jgi:hypothetical protein